MELLAPVGSKEAFVSAIRAGANALYVGMPGFNARMSASSLSVYDLSVMLAFAKEKGVKVYIALNTLIKHEEIAEVVKSIARIEPLMPDGFIVQDLGVASIIKNYFPQINMHASTQMAVHNSMGVDFLAGHGFKRVVLARELSFSELKLIAKNSTVELEVFVHGALCFCISGQCLFSSFIGGLSANRGRCTQPCRRLWKSGTQTGYLFSPKDLELASYIGKLKEIGISSLKIEGRMRSSEYVYKTVKAYRILIDAPKSGFEDALKEAKSILLEDTAREKTTCLFSGRDTNIFAPKDAQCMGNLIGKINNISQNGLEIKVDSEKCLINAGDRLRVANPQKDTTIAFSVKEFTQDGLRYTFEFRDTAEFSVGNPVYKTIDVMCDQKDLEKEINGLYASYAQKNTGGKIKDSEISQKYTSLISNVWKENKAAIAETAKEQTLWVRFANLEWFDILPAANKNLKHAFYLTKENLHGCEKIPGKFLSNITFELPPFIAQRDIPVFKEKIDALVALGVTSWVLNNVSHFGFFKVSECTLSAGQFLYTWNAYTAAFLSTVGVKNITASWEDDFLNIRKMCAPGLGKNTVVYIYGHAPIVRSRMLEKENIGQEVISSYNASQEMESKTIVELLPIYESGLALLIPKKPISFLNAQRKLIECGINNFGVDLTYIAPNKKFLDELFNAYKTQENMPDTMRFNIKRGVM
ncbi:MAG: U32 family peptidase [Endomicrobiales bacterium]|nr:U32 family peptidase [Endomicrobiales bacterium]